MKYIYVILSASPTRIGRIIRACTKGSFSHASISLTKDLREMYSFARYRAHNPFVGGFIQEFPQRLTMGKEAEVLIKIFEIPLTEEQYNKIRDFVYGIRDDEDRCLYNSLAILGRPFGLGYNTYKAYVCTDFVVKALMQGDIHLRESVAAPMTPGEIEQLLDPYLIYNGSLEKYHPAPVHDENLIQDFFRKASPFREVYDAVMHFRQLFSRVSRGRGC